MDFELIIRNGTVIDGSGAPSRPADLAVNGDTIAAVGDLSAARGAAGRTLAGTWDGRTS